MFSEEKQIIFVANTLILFNVFTILIRNFIWETCPIKIIS